MSEQHTCRYCRKPVRQCKTPRPCSGQCSSGHGWIHLSGTHGCDRRPGDWTGSGPYAEPEVGNA